MLAEDAIKSAIIKYKLGPASAKSEKWGCFLIEGLDIDLLLIISRNLSSLEYEWVYEVIEDDHISIYGTADVYFVVMGILVHYIC